MRLARVRRIDPTGTITSVVSESGIPGQQGDGGPAIDARLTEACNLVVDAAGRLLVFDARGGRARRVEADGTIHRVADIAPGEFGTAVADPVGGVHWAVGGRQHALDPSGAVRIDENRGFVVGPFDGAGNNYSTKIDYPYESVVRVSRTTTSYPASLQSWEYSGRVALRAIGMDDASNLDLVGSAFRTTVFARTLGVGKSAPYLFAGRAYGVSVRDKPAGQEGLSIPGMFGDTDVLGPSDVRAASIGDTRWFYDTNFSYVAGGDVPAAAADGFVRGVGGRVDANPADSAGPRSRSRGYVAHASLMSTSASPVIVEGAYADATANCGEGAARSSVARVRVAGVDVPAPVGINQSVTVAAVAIAPVPGTAMTQTRTVGPIRLIFNEQVRTAKGWSVNALRLEIPIEGDVTTTESIIVGHAEAYAVCS